MERLILIIDDSEDDTELYRRLLMKSQLTTWTIHVCSDGESGLEQIKNHSFDCVLLDYSLPGDDGIEILKSLKGTHRYTPVIMLTGQGNENIAVSAIKAGAQDYISKSEMTVLSLDRAISSAISAIQASEKINNQKQELEQFAKVLAHDLKQPAHSICALLNIIEQEYSSSLPEQVSSKLSLVAKTSNQMYNLINALSSYASLELPQPKLELCCFNEVIENACNNLYQPILDKQAIIQVDSLPTLPLIPPLAVQLIQILINNALLYNNNRPVIEISADKVEQHWQITLLDNGIGIEHAFIDKVFEPLTRLHSNAQYQGTGLGLATAKRIVNHHLGNIWCESEPKQGTKFFINLPDGFIV